MQKDVSEATNYCSFFPDKLGSKDWSQCCRQHDKAYELQLPKAEADKELFDCVSDTGGVGMLLIAALMFTAVATVGGIWYRKVRVSK
ncbi:hypothetical protein D3C86_2045680 [compost metagenome]